MSESMMEKFNRACRETRLVRMRENTLFTFGATRLPYVLLAESQINEGDVVVRRGVVSVDRPQIVTLNDLPQFEGFEFDGEAVPVMISRGVHLPAMKYANQHGSLDVVPGPMERAVEKEVNALDRENNRRTGIVVGPEDVWGLSLVHYVGFMIVRSAPSNLGEYFERL